MTFISKKVFKVPEEATSTWDEQLLAIPTGRLCNYRYSKQLCQIFRRAVLLWSGQYLHVKHPSWNFIHTLYSVENLHSPLVGVFRHFEDFLA